MIQANSRFALKSDVRYRIIDEEVVVVVQGRGEVLGLNGTASAAFDLAARGSSFAEIITALLEELEVERLTLETDMRELLTALVADSIFELTP